MPDIESLVRGIVPVATDLRHDLHAHPELCFEEHQTARHILDRLHNLPALNITTGVAGTGIVATLNGDKPGRCVALRADMDALPIQEETGLPYASKHEGKMHACGHDGHVSCLFGAAAVLTQIAADLPGKVKFIFQPAEEGGGGGRAMCEAGVLNDPDVDAIFGLHGWPGLAFGTIGTRSGPILASQDRWTLTVHGKGGHAAWPHQSIDPIVVASHIVTALQTIVSRSTDPLNAVVVTVGEFHAGTASNIIPDTAKLTGTLRALNENDRTRAAEQLRQIAEQIAQSLGASATFELHCGYPVLVNDATAAAFVREVADDVIGSQNVISDMAPVMGAEDFAFFAERIPAAFWCLGVRKSDDSSQPQLHQSTYDFPDDALALGIRLHCEIAMRYLRQG